MCKSTYYFHIIQTSNVQILKMHVFSLPVPITTDCTKPKMKSLFN